MTSVTRADETPATGRIVLGQNNHGKGEVRIVKVLEGPTCHEEVLKAHPEVSRIHFSVPNKYHRLYDLGRFGIENDNETFHASSEPYGLIEGAVERAV